MKLNLQTGRIDSANWLVSPNQDERPHPGFINTVVIHAISLPPEVYGNGYIEEFFCNQLKSKDHPYFKIISGQHVSAHFCIKREGELTQFVSTQSRAWHAGISRFKGQDKVNDFSIGIELEGCDKHAFTEHQYSSLTSLTRALMAAYPAITNSRIIGHSDIAPGRKTDPGPCFDWPAFRQAL